MANSEVPSAVFVSNRKLADGLFMKCCEEVAKQYPNIEFNTMIVDNCSMQVSVDLV